MSIGFWDKLTHVLKPLSGVTNLFSRTKAGLTPQAPTGNETTHYLREDGEWAIPPNDKVRQFPSNTDNANYRVLLSNGANDTDETNLIRKDTNLTYNPSTNQLNVGKIGNGVIIPFTSGDSTDANATSWTSVTKVDNDTSLGTLLNRVTAMMKNTRYLYNQFVSLKNRLDANYVYSYTFGSSAEVFSGNGVMKTYQIRTSVPAGYYIVQLSLIWESSAGNIRDGYIYLEGDREERYYKNESLDVSYSYVGYAVQNALIQFRCNPRASFTAYFTGRFELYRLSR